VHKYIVANKNIQTRSTKCQYQIDASKKIKPKERNENKKKIKTKKIQT